MSLQTKEDSFSFGPVTLSFKLMILNYQHDLSFKKINFKFSSNQRASMSTAHESFLAGNNRFDLYYFKK